MGPAGTGVALRSLVLFHHLSLDHLRDAEVVMGPSLTADLDIRVLRVVGTDGGVSSSALVDRLALPRSTVARALARVLDEELVRRRSDPQDARRAQWQLTGLGQQRLEQYVAATADTFRRHRAPVQQLLLLRGHVPDPAGVGAAAAVLDAVDALRSTLATVDREVARSSEAVALGATVDRAALLAVAERGSTRPGELAEDTGLSPAGVTSLVDRLVGNDLVARERGIDGDGRAVVITPTPSGRRAVEAMVSMIRRHQEALLDALATTLAVGDTTPVDGSGSRPRDERALLH